MSKVSIYQVFTRLFGNTNSAQVINGSRSENGVGKMSDFTVKALTEIKDLGITHVWYTGIIAHARCEGNPEKNLEGCNPKIVKGRAGSPYAICDYYDVNPDLADNVQNRMVEFEELVVRTQTQNLKVIIDFVPNHVAREYKSTVFPETTFGLNDDETKAFSPTNDFYYMPGESLVLPENTGTVKASDQVKNYIEEPAKVTGNDRFSNNVSVNDWYETVKLNYGIDYLNGNTTHFEPVPPLWDKMVNILMFWANKGVDGFRCDMVEMVPVEFWNYAISKIKKAFPDILFVAEVYNPALYHSYIEKGRFDYLYDKVGLYDTLKEVITNNASTSGITKCWQAVEDYSDKMLSFMENHDEQRIASRFFAGDPLKALPAFLLSATINNGAIMTYFGQEVGEPAEGTTGFSGDDGRTTIFDYFNVPEFHKWVNNKKFDGAKLSEQQVKLRNAYQKILNFAIAEPVFSEGAFYDLMWMNSFDGAKEKKRIFTYLRFTKTECILMAINFADYSQQFVLKVPDDAIRAIGFDGLETIKVQGVYMDNNTYDIKQYELKDRGFWINLPAYSGKGYSLVGKK